MQDTGKITDPMPLKHGTETRLVLLLGFMIALAGAAAAFLPPLSVSVIPWAIAFIVSIIYPLALYPLFKERRADYEFRALHFVPALMLLLWLSIDILAGLKPQWQAVQLWATWGWSVLIVLVAFVLLALFCLRVIRQRWPRMALLFAVLLPFLFISQLSERMRWDEQMAMVLWGAEGSGTGMIAGTTSGNLAPSTDTQEEQWRAQLRQMERRRQQLEENGTGIVAARSSSSVTVNNSKSSAVIAANSFSSRSFSTVKSSSSSSKAPPRLPSSGFGSEAIALTMMGLFTATMHRRAMRKF